MALHRTQQGFLRELDSSDAQFNPHLAGYDRDLLRICGPAYGGSSDLIDGDPENHWQEWLSIFLPKLVLNNPRCDCSTERQEWPPERSIAVEYSVNDWFSQTEIKYDFERCMTDYSIRYAGGIVLPEPIEDHTAADDVPWLPAFYRLSPHDLRWDAAIRDHRRARWIGHRYVLDIEDVIHRAEKNNSEGWDLAWLREIEKTSGADPRELSRVRPGTMPDRKQIVLWDIWDRYHTLPGAPSRKRGYNGSWFTVLDKAHADRRDKWIREPRPAFGPRRGRYCIGGAMMLGDLPIPLAPLIANTPQAVYLNKIARAIMKAVHDYKRIGVTTDSALADKIEFGDDGAIFSVDGVDVRQVVAQLELGGITSQLLAAKEDARQTLDRNSGLHEAARGNITGVATATEVRAAEMSTDLRSGFLIDKARDFVRQAAKVAAFDFDVNSDVVSDIGPLPFHVKAPDGRMTPYAKHRGGLPRGRGWTADDHERLNLRIDPNSTARTDEQTKLVRFQMLNNTLATVAQIPPPIAVAMDLPWYLRQAEDASGLRDMEKLFNAEVYYGMQYAMMQQPNQGKPEGSRTPQSRFAWNSFRPQESITVRGGGGQRHGGNKSEQRSMRALPAKGGSSGGGSSRGFGLTAASV